MDRWQPVSGRMDVLQGLSAGVILVMESSASHSSSALNLYCLAPMACYSTCVCHSNVISHTLVTTSCELFDYLAPPVVSPTFTVMVRVYKPGKIVIMLKGRYAGQKGVVLKQFDEGAGSRQYGHALVAGIAKGPKRVTKGM